MEPETSLSTTTFDFGFVGFTELPKEVESTAITMDSGGRGTLAGEVDGCTTGTTILPCFGTWKGQTGKGEDAFVFVFNIFVVSASLLHHLVLRGKEVEKKRREEKRRYLQVSLFGD